MVTEITNTEKVEAVFGAWPETILWSCLQRVMGNIYADSPDSPASAIAVLGDFCFLAGLPKKELVSFKPTGCARNFIIMIPQNEEWARLITRHYGGRARRVTRYATKKEENGFDRNRLKEAAGSLAPAYTLKRIDEAMFDLCRSNGWSRDLVSQYADYRSYERLGLGFVVMKGEEPVSGASSYSSYKNGIELEIDTKEEYRRNGLACACGARLILECLARGWHPSWDAQNKASLALAKKLGYHFDHAYPAFEINGW